ncbi:hypothetical protein COCON_G00195080, partial [Conger conger]
YLGGFFLFTSSSTGPATRASAPLTADFADGESSEVRLELPLESKAQARSLLCDAGPTFELPGLLLVLARKFVQMCYTAGPPPK